MRCGYSRGWGWRKPSCWACLLVTFALLLGLQAGFLCCSGGGWGRGKAGVCGCLTCVAQRGTDSWFDERFNPRVEPLLSTENPQIHPDTLRWWLRLQSGRTTQVDVTKWLLKAGVMANPYRGSPQPSRCRSCAVVGNSGNLRGSQYGKLIDSHKFVLRMNRAAIAGFEGDVGMRTTHHLLYPESARDLEPGVHLVLLPFKPLDLMWISSALSTGHINTTYTRVKRFIKADRDKVLVIHPEFFEYVHNRWTERHGRYPSTGLLALVFALHLCDQVSVFGYGADAAGNWHHYWERNRNARVFRAMRVHNSGFEKQVIARLATGGKIQLYPGKQSLT